MRRQRSCWTMLVGSLLCTAVLSAAEKTAALRSGLTPLRVSIDFPSGSGRVQLDQPRRRIVLRPTEHEGRGWACWWYIKVSGAIPGEMLTLEVGDAPWATPDRAAVSWDNRIWRQTERGKREGKRIVFRCRAAAPELWLAWGPPFTPQDAQQLVSFAARECEAAEAFELCRTRTGRVVPALRFRDPANGDDRPPGVWIQARQHAWESGSSWVCRGLVEWLASDDPRAMQLRKKAVITVVPIMDLDNVAIGAGGKNQLPHDHNRDWGPMPHWQSVAAAMKHIKRQDEAGRFVLFIDLHNPGPGSKQPYYYITPRKMLSESGQRNLDRFLAVSRLEMVGPLAFEGETHESGPDYDSRWQFISKNWVSFHTHKHVVALTLETAWNTPHSTTAGYRTVGRQLGAAIERYLRVDPRLPSN